MSNSIHSLKFCPARKLLVAGVAVLALFSTCLHAQYVSTAISNNLSEPFGVAEDPSLNVYVTDGNNDRVIEYVPSNTNVSTFAGQFGVAGTNNGTGSAALFSNPQGIVYARGGLIVVDSGNQELRYLSLAGVVTNLAGIPGVSGTNDGSALGAAEFQNPTGIAADAAGNIYIADQGNNKIRMLSTANVVSTIGTNHSFYRPTAVTVDGNGNIWVADTGNQQICMISNGVAIVEAGTRRVIGTNDTSLINHSGPLFNLPSGLFWSISSNVLFISDTGNDTIRELYLTNFQGASTNYVYTLTGGPGLPGWVDGQLTVARFNQPLGICADTADSGYYVVDSGNNALRVLQPIQPPPPPVPIATPVIGYITFPLNANGIPSAQFNPFPSNGPVEVFNNPVYIAIKQIDQPVGTYYTQGATGSVLAPNTNSPSPLLFDYPGIDTGLAEGQLPSTLESQITPLPDLTVDVISLASGRPSSSVISSRIQFVMANPTIVGNNAAAIVLDDITTNAQMYYTIDGTTPAIGATNTFGPVGTNTTISFNITSNTTLSVEAFPPPNLNFAPSGVVTELLSPTNFAADQLTFGFESGECSSKFIGAPGQTFIAPITLTLIPTGQTIDSMQFNLAVATNTAATPNVTTNSPTFSSMLQKPIPNTNPTIYTNIIPAMFALPTNISFTNIVVLTNPPFTNLLFTNVYSNISLLGVGWEEEQGSTNLYNTLQQTLITFSQAHDTMFLNTGGRVVVGAFSFYIPTNAPTNGTGQYIIGIGSPSATLDGQSIPVYLQTVTNGSLTNGTINSIKYVTVGSAKYLVGDVAPFYWFNAGDFGNQTLEANDVDETFQTAVYGLNGPNPATASSDYFNAMDSSDGTDNNLYNGTDLNINSILNGDGIIAVDDVFVTFRRSLDPSLSWVERADTANGRIATLIPSGLPPPFTGAAQQAPVAVPAANSQSGPHAITVAADQVLSGGNSTVQVPIRIVAADTLPVTVMMLRVEVDPLDGSPPLTSPVTFSSAASLGTSYTTTSQDKNDFAGVWLNSTNAGIVGTGIIGTLTVTLPAGVNSSSAYLVHFDHFSASPNGLALFHSTIQDGLITTVSRTNSSWNDGIPDSWRLLWFSSVYNSLSAANADPDGDGASNWQEYIAGTNPNDKTSVFSFTPGSAASNSGCTLQWPSIVNKHYSIQTSLSITQPQWTTVATNLVGTGQVMQWNDSNPSGKGQFYRASVQ